ncbi:MAG: hypothetical protein RDV41_01745 [Planctomycetota bacterium]|nr:hypothetical protein [Planctomycetota bacterium]
MPKKEAPRKSWQDEPVQATAYTRFVQFLNKYQNVIFGVVTVFLLCVVAIILWRRHSLQKELDACMAVDRADKSEDLLILLGENLSTPVEPMVRYKLAAAYGREGKNKEALAQYNILRDKWTGKSVYALFAADAPVWISQNAAFVDEVLPAKLKELDTHYSESFGPPAPEPEKPVGPEEPADEPTGQATPEPLE